MPSEKLASAENLLKGNLASAWNILEGSSGDYTDLGIARRFGGAAAAYSLRDVGAMNGRVVRVRRDSDDTEQDFSANQVISGALESFVGSGNNGFVTTWYDQSGNGLDMVQAATGSQPKIVSSGTQVKSNNLPAITFADNAVHLERAEFLTGQLGGYFIVGNTLKADQDGTDAQVMLRQGSSYRIAVELINAGNIRSFLRDSAGDNADARTSSSTVGDDEVFLNTTILTARGSTGLANYFNGGDESTDDTTDIEDTDFSSADTGNISIGSIPAGTFDYKGELMEIILFNTNVSSERTDIENEINSYYQIY